MYVPYSPSTPHTNHKSRYGPAPNNADTAVNILIDVVSDQSGKKYNMDHYATRFPTNVVDIADFLVRLAGLPPITPLPPILHYSAPEPFTKYEMCLIFAKILGLPHEHIVPDANAPTVRRLIPLCFKMASHGIYRAQPRPVGHETVSCTRVRRKISWPSKVGSGGHRLRNGGRPICRRNSEEVSKRRPMYSNL